MQPTARAAGKQVGCDAAPKGRKNSYDTDSVGTRACPLSPLICSPTGPRRILPPRRTLAASSSTSGSREPHRERLTPRRELSERVAAAVDRDRKSVV